MSENWRVLMSDQEIAEHTRRIVYTWTEEETLAYLCKLARNADIIVESGTYMGASAFAMLTAAKATTHMWCIDKFMVAGTEFVTRRNLTWWIERSQVELIVGDSQRGGDMLQHMRGRVDLQFIDDGHAKEDVMRDIRCLYPLLRPGGIMVGHDWEGDNDVAQGVKASGLKYFLPLPRLWAIIKE